MEGLTVTDFVRQFGMIKTDVERTVQILCEFGQPGNLFRNVYIAIQVWPL